MTTGPRRRKQDQEKPKRYGVNGLPMGVWTAIVEPFGPGFLLVHTDASTGDRVEAFIVPGGDEQYSRKATGIPLRLDPKRLWHLARIEPRTSKAYGGTKATVEYLAAEADKDGTWIITEVMAENQQRNPAVIRALKKYGDFEDVPDPHLQPRLLVRRPKASKRF